MKEKAKEWLVLFRVSPGVALSLLFMAGNWVLANPLQRPMDRIQNILCSIVDTLAGPFGGALAVFMLALGFAGLIIGNRNSMGLIITAIAGGALLLAAKTLGNTIVGNGCGTQQTP
jgi:type IV secretory pathway VirB2 component (pilin)